MRTEVVGRLDHLVEAVYERFKDRYFKGECMPHVFPHWNLHAYSSYPRCHRRPHWNEVSRFQSVFQIRSDLIIVPL